ncbi:MAG: hypothetical protein ACLTDR_06130 [Adlercreutzia equolifaciens]
MNNGKTDGIQASFANIPGIQRHGPPPMRPPTVDASGSDRGGRRRGRDRLAYRAIGGYVWKDNDYKDGIYNLIPGTYARIWSTLA